MEPPGTTSILPAFVSFYHYPRAFVTDLRADPSVPRIPWAGPDPSGTLTSLKRLKEEAEAPTGEVPNPWTWTGWYAMV